MERPNFEHGLERVLVVDPDRGIRPILKTQLYTFNVPDIRFVDSGEDGLQMLAESSVDLIIVEYRLPQMSGIQFARKLRTDAFLGCQYTPIIMLTSMAVLEIVEKARDAGIHEFLTKPLSTHHLFEKLKRVITKPRSFVQSAEYFGPDRRRRAGRDYEGPMRRDADDGIGYDD